MCDQGIADKAKYAFIPGFAYTPVDFFEVTLCSEWKVISVTSVNMSLMMFL